MLLEQCVAWAIHTELNRKLPTFRETEIQCLLIGAAIHVCEVRVTFRPLPPSSVHQLVLQPPVLYEEHFTGEVFGLIKRALSDVIL